MKLFISLLITISAFFLNETLTPKPTVNNVTKELTCIEDDQSLKELQNALQFNQIYEAYTFESEGENFLFVEGLMNDKTISFTSQYSLLDNSLVQCTCNKPEGHPLRGVKIVWIDRWLCYSNCNFS